MKIQRISQYQGTLRFPNFEDYNSVYFSSFLDTDLGKIYSSIPWEELVNALGLKDKRKGPQSRFSPRGKLALMFLKHYACCSDNKLIEQLNGNIDYQIFCDILLPVGFRIKNFKIVSAIRSELSKVLDVDKLQRALAQHWKPYLNNLSSISCDATCYETYMRYPTDIKLLHELVEWNHSQMVRLGKSLGRRKVRTKINHWRKRYTAYSKSRRPSKKEKRALYRGLLRLGWKIDEALCSLEIEAGYEGSNQYRKRRLATGQALEQQWNKFFKDIKPSDRIVSLDKPYIRPIIRGKEVKSVEFGAKVHKLQIDGISFIEHMSFDAFNEGIRLKQTIHKARQLTLAKVKLLGADGIYANNANRRYVTQHNIKTDFKRKGKPSKHKSHFDQLAKMITKERASRLEGSFGTDKEHFLLNRIKARNQLTEKLWIFFGIHTSNALNIGKRMALSQALAA